MRKVLLAVCVLSFSGLAIAHATPLAPGSSVSASALAFGGAQVGFFNGTVSANGLTSNYASEVFVDPLNTFCAGCFDFVFNIDHIAGVGSITDVVVGSYGTTLTNVGFSGPGTNPVTISRSADGSLIDFNFTGIPLNFTSSFLVVQTNFTNFNLFGTIGTQGGVAGTSPALQPLPEPGSLLLLGTGLAGFAGVMRKRFLA